ncbi:hypothetical protein LZ31DRAFT_485147 [Colletotrichum somersetense]|nr:hypothetical protein LZ31DRAFT_485147 [Colletotrichum somersetense]
MKNEQRLSSGSSFQRPTFSAADLTTSTSPPASNLLSPCLTTEPQSPVQDILVPLPQLELPSLEKHGERYKLFYVRVEWAYDYLLNQKHFRRSKKSRRRRDIMNQKAVCLEIVESLVEAVVKPPLEATSSQDASIEICSRIDDSLNSLWMQLSCLARNITTFGQRHEVRLPRMKSLFQMISSHSPDCIRAVPCLLKSAGKLLQMNSKLLKQGLSVSATLPTS